MPWYILVPAVGLIACLWYFGEMARSHVATTDARLERKVRWFGHWSDKTLFTEEGWRYRNRARLCWWLLVALTLAWGVTEALK